MGRQVLLDFAEVNKFKGRFKSTFISVFLSVPRPLLPMLVPSHLNLSGQSRLFPCGWPSSYATFFLYAHLSKSHTCPGRSLHAVCVYTLAAVLFPIQLPSLLLAAPFNADVDTRVAVRYLGVDVGAGERRDRQRRRGRRVAARRGRGTGQRARRVAAQLEATPFPHLHATVVPFVSFGAAAATATATAAAVAEVADAVAAATATANGGMDEVRFSEIAIVVHFQWTQIEFINHRYAVLDFHFQYSLRNPLSFSVVRYSIFVLATLMDN